MNKVLAILFLPIVSFAQVHIDTLKGIVAYKTTFTQGNIRGKTNEGNVYDVNFVNHYLHGSLFAPQNMEVTKTDLITHITTQKEIPVLSSTSSLWLSCMDSLGNVYQSFNTNARKVVKLNFKGDTIDYKDLGLNPNNALVYSMSLGLDKNMYFGCSSGSNNQSTEWAEYNPYTDSIHWHPAVNQNQDYVLSIQGDTDWVYLQVGQRTYNEYWAVRKSDDYKKKLFQISSSSRFQIKTGKDGFNYVYFADWQGSHTYRLKDTTCTLISSYNGILRNDYFEVNCPNLGCPTTTATSYYNEPTQQLIFNVNGGVFDSTLLVSDSIKNGIAWMFQFPNDNDHIYYTGGNYGNWYDSNLTEHTVYKLGASNHNTYSYLPVNDSECYIAGYPNGNLGLWNRNQAWTAQTFFNGAMQGMTNYTNPKFILDFRTSTPAGFHTPNALLQDDNGNIVCFGTVIRTQNSWSVGVYNPNTGQSWGYDCNKLTGQGLKGIVKWNGLFVISTNNAYGGHAKIYEYNSLTNQMVDSIDLGFTNYGNLFINNDTLTGITTTLIYKINLVTKQLLITYPVSLYAAFRLDYKECLVYSNFIPDTSFIRFNYGNGLYAPYNHSVFTIDGNNNVLWVKNLYTPPPQFVKIKTFSIYPNPAKDFVYLKKGDYLFYNFYGELKLHVINGNDGLVNISKLSSGVYYLKNNDSVKKMIVIK